MSGTLGTVVLVAGVTSGVFSISGVVEVVPVRVSFVGVVTTIGVGGAGDFISVSFSSLGGGVPIIVVGVSEMVVSIIIGVGAGVSTSVSVSFSGLVTKMGEVVVSGNVDIEPAVMVKVCVIGTVLGVSLTVTTVLFTR